MTKQTRSNIQKQLVAWTKDYTKLVNSLNNSGEETSDKKLKQFQTNYEKLMARGQELNQKLSLATA
jgi:hypothetical protein